MELLNSIFQAIIQGLTEFLPVSSSGHLALVQHFTNTSTETSATFFSAILHLGTLVAVFIQFRQTIGRLIIEFFKMIKDIFTGKFKLKEMNGERRMIIMLIISTLPLVVLLPVKDSYDKLVSNGGLIFLGVCFLLTTALLLISDKCVKGHKTAKDMKYRDSIAIGLSQAVATLPGISRSGATVSTSLICGLSKKTAVQYSFILGIPAILGAGLVEVKDAIEIGAPINWLPVIVGFFVSAIVGFFAIKMISWIIKTDKFKWFGYYTAVLGVITVGLGVYELIVK